MKTLLFNTAHPLSESGKPIFIPFGEWDYDGTCRQRLDRVVIRLILGCCCNSRRTPPFPRP